MAHTSVRAALLVAFGFVIVGAVHPAPTASSASHAASARAFVAATAFQTRITEEARASDGTEDAPSFAMPDAEEGDDADTVELAKSDADEALDDEMREGNMPEPMPPSDPASETESESGAPEDSDEPEVA